MAVVEIELAFVACGISESGAMVVWRGMNKQGQGYMMSGSDALKFEVFDEPGSVRLTFTHETLLS